MAARIVRLVCIFMIALWLTGKVLAFSPILAIMLIGATVIYTINEVKEIKDEKKHAKKRNSRNKKVKTTKS